MEKRVRRHWLSRLRIRLLVLVLLAVVPAAGVILYAGWEGRDQATLRAQADLQRQARLAASQGGPLLEGARELLHALVVLPPVQQGDAQACSALFNTLLAQYPQYANLGVSRANGNVFCSALALPGPVSLADRGYFRRARADRTFAVGRYQVGRITGRPGLNFGLPVVAPAGTVAGVAFAALDLAWLNALVARLELPPGTTLTILDRQGVLLARGEGAGAATDLDGTPSLVAFAPLGAPAAPRGVFVSIGVPQALVVAAANRLLRRSLIWLGVVAVLALAVAWTGGDLFLLRQIQALLAAARRLAAGDLRARSGLPAGPGELYQLARAFDEMAAALEDRITAHERALADIESLARFPGEDPNPVLRIREDGALLYANEPSGPLLRLWGIAPGGPVPAEWGVKVRQALETGGQETIELLCGDRIYSIDLTPVSATRYVNLYGRDVTDRRLAEETLQLRTRQLETVRAVTAEITRELDLTAVLLLISQRAAELAGVGLTTVWLWDEASQTLAPGASYGMGDWMGNRRLRLGEGVSGIAAQRREGLIVNDYRTWPARDPRVIDHSGVTAMLAEPLLYRDQLLGVIRLADQGTGRQFTAEDQAMLRLFAAQAAIAIENARLFQGELRRWSQLEAMRAAGLELIRELDLSVLLDLILHRAMEPLGSQSGTVFLWDEEAQVLVPATWVGFDERRHADRLRLGEGVAGTVAQRRAGMIVNDFRTSPYARSTILARTQIASVLAEPLLYRERLVGVIIVNRETGQPAFVEEELKLLTLFAPLAATAIENAQLYEDTRRHAADLEERVAARTAELAAANEELAAASRHKSEFLANMSHELRTPLNGILGFAQILQEQAGPALSEKQRRYLGHIYGSGQHLLTLINDILDLAKVEAGKIALQPEPLPVAQTLEDLLVIARGLASEKGQVLTAAIAPDLPPLTADPVRVKQILFNLLSNAVKFTPEQGTITLTARALAEAPGRGDAETAGDTRDTSPQLPGTPAPRQFLELAVTDTGVGIKAGDLPKLFHEFTQLETTRTQAHEGTGLGLALTKRLVELHGGRIWAASPGEGQGSTFTVVLPLGGFPA